MEIKMLRFWNMEDVRNMCIREGFYTLGESSDYDRILTYVDRHRINPTNEDIYIVALNILANTDGCKQQTVENIMYILANDVIRYAYEIER